MSLPDLGVQTYQTDLFLPVYPETLEGEWQMSRAEFQLCPGYWSDTLVVQGMVGLTRRGQTWMSTSPMELESQEIGVRLSRGHVLIYGLGMGWAACVCALREEVTAVTVVELDPDILALHQRLDLFRQLPPAAQARIRVVQGDAFHYVPDRPVDLFMPDIWQPLMNDGRVAEVQAMQQRVQAAAVYFWGQELEIARHAVAAGRALDDAGIAATIADFRMPVIGPEFPNYTDLLTRAARRWIRGRWLPGSPRPW